MSRKSITSMLGAVLLSALGSACVVYPQPSSDGNGNVSRMSEPIAYFGDVMLFEDKNQPLAVQVQAAASADNLSLTKAMQDTLYESDVKVVANSDPCDVKIRLQSKYE